MKCLLLPLLWSLCLLFASAQDAAVPQKQPPHPAVSKGMVWKVTGGNCTVYLAGSIHLLRKSDHPLPPVFETAYQDASQLVFEIPPSEMNDPKVAMKMLAAAMLEDGKSLNEVLSADGARALQEWKGDALTKSVVAKMKPAMAALAIMEFEYARLKIRPEHGVEAAFEKKAAADGKPVTGLETVDFQLGLFLDMPLALQDQMLRETLAQLKRTGKIMEEMIGWWRTGDDAALGKSMHEEFADFPEIEKRLLLDRNAAWVPKVEKLLAGDKNTLLIVGAGHLCGKGSVIDLLEKTGRKVTRVEPY
ncbi:MAG: TraB/GumN family protein [Verrucomicrobiales bacterium]|nr:TraB/GumN family protein [Verrucomicrobiales bacterium]